VIQAAWDRLVPGLRDRFDADRLLPLIAPRPLLILSHEKDELMPLVGAREAYVAARARYQASAQRIASGWTWPLAPTRRPGPG